MTSSNDAHLDFSFELTFQRNILNTVPNFTYELIRVMITVHSHCKNRAKPSSDVVKMATIMNLMERGSYMVWEINMGICPRLGFYNKICYLIVLGMTFIFMFYVIPLLIHDVMNDITVIP